MYLVLLFVLFAMPPALMALSHVFAVFHQDKKEHCVVVLVERASPQRVAGDHARKYKVRIDRLYDSSVKGYAALVPTSAIARIEADRRVASITRRENVDESDRWIAAS